MVLTSVILFMIFGSLKGVTVRENENIEKIFQEFIDRFNRNYAVGSNEYLKRLHIFEDNLALHKKLNLNRTSPHSAIYGINKFSDLSQEEFKGLYLSSYTTIHQDEIQAIPTLSDGFSSADLPSKVDWRTKDVITAVKNQESCGGCWAYASVETVESMYAKHSGHLLALSVQQVLDCSNGYDSRLSSCNGGDTCEALKWMMKQQVALQRSKDYPTTNKIEDCRITRQSGVYVNNYTCSNVVGKEDLLLGMLAHVGPVTISVDASMWNNYQGGIIQYHCGEVPNNHAVQIVGYDLTGPIPYYIVKNSWGKDFGLDGFLYLEVYKNICGLADEVATVSASNHP